MWPLSLAVVACLLTSSNEPATLAKCPESMLMGVLLRRCLRKNMGWQLQFGVMEHAPEKVSYKAAGWQWVERLMIGSRHTGQVEGIRGIIRREQNCENKSRLGKLLKEAVRKHLLDHLLETLWVEG